MTEMPILRELPCCVHICYSNLFVGGKFHDYWDSHESNENWHPMKVIHEIDTIILYPSLQLLHALDISGHAHFKHTCYNKTEY